MTDVLSVGNMGMVPEDDPTDPKKNIHLRLIILLKEECCEILTHYLSILG